MRTIAFLGILTAALTACAPATQNTKPLESALAPGQVWSISWADGSQVTATVPAVTPMDGAFLYNNSSSTSDKMLSFFYIPAQAGEPALLWVSIEESRDKDLTLYHNCDVYNLTQVEPAGTNRGIDYRLPDYSSTGAARYLYMQYVANVETLGAASASSGAARDLYMHTGDAGNLPRCTLTRVK